MGTRAVVAYEPKIRSRACKCFEAGMGYKMTATMLKIPTSTVRDWKRLWVKGEFTVRNSYRYTRRSLNSRKISDE